MQVNPYLSFAGNCEEAFQFYETALDGKITFIMRNRDAPGEAAPAGWEDKILHVSFSFAGGTLMGSDTPPAHYVPPAGTWVSISLNDAGRAEAIFASLSAGGSIMMPIQKTFWAARFGMVTDRFGTPWMINCE